ncbi:hypothetical protein HGRIS_009003 [Hohenbuehelia grisea]|uniref:Lectin n=1 Tax=Hohenbuehelia grisea TaxID=104357 RepID=A0ABR3J090_9AGAR
MFKNGGNEPFEFEAQYADTVIRKGVKQIDEGQGEFSLVLSATDSILSNNPIAAGEYDLFGLTVYKHSVISDWPMETILWVQAWHDPSQIANGDPSQSDVISLPLGFNSSNP